MSPLGISLLPLRMVFIVSLLLLMVIKGHYFCPSGCYCMPKEAPIVVDCNERNFTKEMFDTVPSGAMQL